MSQNRIGNVLILAAAAWMAMLAVTEPGSTASPNFRTVVGITAVGMVVVAFFPRHLYLTGTVLAFTMLGLSLHIGLFGIFGIGLQGLLPAAVFAIAMWFIRDRLDASAVVVVTSLVSCGLAMIQPGIVLFAFIFIGIANVLIWLANFISRPRANR